MNRAIKQKIFSIVALVAVLTGATIAAVTAAQTSGHRRPSGTLATAAGYLGVPSAQLQAELRSGKSLAQIAAQSSGRSAAGLTQALIATRTAQIAAAAAQVPQRVRAEVQRAGGPDGHRVSATLSYLGLTPAALQADLRAGRTLAQIASATSGRSEAGLIDALVRARKQAIAAMVAAGTLTQRQANARLGRLAERVRLQVERPRSRGAAARRSQHRRASATTG
jgi:hypothetical protein